MDNRSIARELSRLARYLVDQRASLYRVRAYRRAAETVLGLEEPVEKIVLSNGRAGLAQLPGIGDHISATIESLVRTGSTTKVNESQNN
jgi:DNA polymerase/3'-5' exonuclease PolX